MNDNKVYAFLVARRKAIACLLGLLSILEAGDVIPDKPTSLIIQSIMAVLTLYGVHEVENTTS